MLPFMRFHNISTFYEASCADSFNQVLLVRCNVSKLERPDALDLAGGCNKE